MRELTIAFPFSFSRSLEPLASPSDLQGWEEELVRGSERNSARATPDLSNSSPSKSEDYSGSPTSSALPDENIDEPQYQQNQQHQQNQQNQEQEEEVPSEEQEEREERDRDEEAENVNPEKNHPLWQHQHRHIAQNGRAKQPERNLLALPKVKVMYNKNHLPTDIREDEYYYEWVEEILEAFPNKGPPFTPSRLGNHMYIGSLINAEDEVLLKRLGITHVLNCAGTRRFDLDKSPYPKDVGVKEYRMIPAEDFEDYDIVQHFSTAFAFIDRCRHKGGKCLVHCNLGVNRSGAVCAGYLMMSEGKSLLQVIEHLKDVRSVILTNRGFRYQLINYARMRNLLDPIINDTGLPATIPPPIGNSKFARGASREAPSRKQKGASLVPPATDFLNINGVKSSSCYYMDRRTGGRERVDLPPRPSSACGIMDAPVSSRSFTRSSSAMGVTNRWSSAWSDMDIDEYLDDEVIDQNPYRYQRRKRPPSSAYTRPSSALDMASTTSYSGSAASASPSASPMLSSFFRHKPVYSSTSRPTLPSFSFSSFGSSSGSTSSFSSKPQNILNLLSKTRTGTSRPSNGYASTPAPAAYQTLTIPLNGGISYNLPKPPFGTSRRRFGPKSYSSVNF